jgi:pimeloyl-ACP methyl ester carboxylesterase
MSPEPVLLKSIDGASITGAFYAADQLRGQALLLHMMPATKESWSAFAYALAERGIACLAIDFRGHGASDGGPDGYRRFSDAEHQAKRLDVDAALAWLRGKGAAPLRVAGASIGANLAIRAAAEHDDIVACLALSPGLAYRGVTTADAVAGMREGQRLCLAVSAEDAQSAESVDVLEKAATAARLTVHRLADAGHGTAMLERDAAFFDEAVAWMAS